MSGERKKSQLGLVFSNHPSVNKERGMDYAAEILGKTPQRSLDKKTSYR